METRNMYGIEARKEENRAYLVVTATLCACVPIIRDGMVTGIDMREWLALPHAVACFPVDNPRAPWTDWAARRAAEKLSFELDESEPRMLRSGDPAPMPPVMTSNATSTVSAT